MSLADRGARAPPCDRLPCRAGASWRTIPGGACDGRYGADWSTAKSMLATIRRVAGISAEHGQQCRSMESPCGRQPAGPEHGRYIGLAIMGRTIGQLAPWPVCRTCSDEGPFAGTALGLITRCLRGIRCGPRMYANPARLWLIPSDRQSGAPLWSGSQATIRPKVPTCSR